MKKILIATAVAAAFGMANAAEQADIVVIGAGGAGMAAAVQAHDNGIKKVVIIEKMPMATRSALPAVSMLLKLRSRPSSVLRTASNRCTRTR